MRFLVQLSSVLLLLISMHAVGAQFVSAERPINVEQPKFDYDIALKTSQDVIGQQVSNHVFIDADNKQVNLNDFRGKPLIISMVYTSCYQICPMTTRHLSKVVEKARDALGADTFNVAVIGFDTRADTPDAMQYFANKQGISDKNWNLWTVKEENLEKLSQELGFIYYSTSNGFDHLIQATVIDADGKVYRQVYGQVFDTPLLVDPLLELILGRPKPEQSFLASLGDRIKLFCTTYDPHKDGYYFDYSMFVEIFVGITVIGAISLFIRRELKKGNKAA